MRARLLAALGLSLAALGCGETLVDHTAPNLFAPDPGTTVVVGDCNTDNACGPTCTPCPAPDPAAVTTGYASAAPECYGPTGASFCGYECTGGLIKCPTGCCQARAVAASAASSCAVTMDGGLYCWGDNGGNQVADGDTSARTAPVLVHGAGVSAVAVGEGFTCAVVAGAVSCRGRFRDGSGVPSPAIPGAVQLAAGADHVCALTAAGAVRCWGSDALGQRGGAGIGTPPVATPVGSGATAVAAGTDHTCAVVGGDVRCWGSRAAGQLGDGSSIGSSGTPVAAAPLASAPAGAIGAGALLACAAPAVSGGSGGLEDALQCWGTGLGSLLPASPQTTPAIPLKDANTSIIRFQVHELAVGRAHVCARRNEPAASVSCLAADNAWGQRGAPSVTPPEAFDVANTQGARAFAAGAEHGCAVLSTGAVQCWGRNSSGQLGDGSRVTPGVDDARGLGTPVLVRGK